MFERTVSDVAEERISNLRSLFIIHFSSSVFISINNEHPFECVFKVVICKIDFILMLNKYLCIMYIYETGKKRLV